MKTIPKSKPKKPEAQNQSQTKTESSPSDGDFSFAVARIAVSQICQSVGFKSAQNSALEILTSVAGKYIESLAKSSASAAASANRTDSNVFDLAAALRDLRSGPAISAANVHQNSCALGLMDLNDIADFINCTVETPFAKPVPRPQPQSGSGIIGIGGESDSIVRAPHVPNWLPEFPTTKEALRELRCREELWGHFVGRNEAGLIEVEDCKDVVLRERKLGLGTGRERVRFKWGLRVDKSRNGNHLCVVKHKRVK